MEYLECRTCGESSPGFICLTCSRSLCRIDRGWRHATPVSRGIVKWPASVLAPLFGSRSFVSWKFSSRVSEDCPLDLTGWRPLPRSLIILHYYISSFFNVFFLFIPLIHFPYLSLRAFTLSAASFTENEEKYIPGVLWDWTAVVKISYRLRGHQMPRPYDFTHIYYIHNICIYFIHSLSYHTTFIFYPYCLRWNIRN